MMARVDLDAVRTAGRRFLTWWGRELISLAPPALRVSADPPSDTVRLTTSHSTTTVERLMQTADGLAASEALISFDLPLPELSPEQWQALAVHGAGRDIVIRLAAPYVYQTRLQLPALAWHKIIATTRLQLPHIAPVASSAVLFDARPLGRGKGGQAFPVAVAMVLKTTADHLIGRCQGHGLRSPMLVAEGPDGQLFRFTRPAVRRVAPARRTQLRLLAMLGMLLLGAAPLLEAVARWQASREAERLAVLEQQLAPRLAATAAQAWIAQAGQVLLAAARQPGVTGLINELAAKLPDNAWVQQLEVLPGQITVEGLATDPSAVLAALRMSPTFAQARLERAAAEPGMQQVRFVITVAAPGGVS